MYNIQNKSSICNCKVHDELYTCQEQIFMDKYNLYCEQLLKLDNCLNDFVEINDKILFN